MNLLHGFALTFVAGLAVGFCLWPLKRAKVSKWEYFWLFFSFSVLILVPFTLAFLLLPHLAWVYRSLKPSDLILPLTLGDLWGFAQLGAGISAHKLGFAVSGALMNGIGTRFGTLLPLFLLHSSMMFQKSGLLIFAGVAVMLIRGGLCGWSGYRREEAARDQGPGSGFSPEQSAMTHEAMTRRLYLLFVAMTVASGILGALLNVALAYGEPVMKAARLQGATPSWAPFAVWPMALLGGSVVNIGYCVYLLAKNGTWKDFSVRPIEGLFALLAGCLWMGGIALYSSGTTFLGVLGVSIGYALYAITMVVSGQLVWQARESGRRWTPAYADGSSLALMLVSALPVYRGFKLCRSLGKPRFNSL